MWKPTYVIDDQVKLCMFWFLLIGRVKDWLWGFPNGIIHTLIELEDTFLERYYSNAQFFERKTAISNFSQEESESFSDARERFNVTLQVPEPQHEFDGTNDALYKRIGNAHPNVSLCLNSGYIESKDWWRI